MKKILFILMFMFVFTMSGIVVFAEDTTTNNDEVTSSVVSSTETIDTWMPDKNLQNVVGTALNKKVSEITQADLEKLEKLVANNQSIHSIKGLEYATNLVWLELENNYILNFSYLKNLDELEKMPANNQVVQLDSVKIDGEQYTQLYEKIPKMSTPFGEVAASYFNASPQAGENVQQSKEGFVWTKLNPSGTFYSEYNISFMFPKLYQISWKVYQDYTRKIENQSVTVRYIDSYGETIHDSQVITGQVGDTYNAGTTQYQLMIEGYTLDESQLPTNMSGQLTETAQTVTYIYSKDTEPTTDSSSSTDTSTTTDSSSSTDTSTTTDSGSSTDTSITTNFSQPIDKRMLPRTGEKNDAFVTIVGVTLIMVGFGFTFLKLNRKNN